LTTPVRRPVRRTVSPVGAAAAGAVVGALASRAAFGSARRSRRTAFQSTIAIPAARSLSFANEEDEIADLFEKIGNLQEAAMLSAVSDDLDEMNALTSSLPHDLQSVRQRGYVHEAQLEGLISDLVGQSESLDERVSDALYRQQTDLVEAANRLLDTVDRLYEASAGRATVDSCWAGVRALQSRIEAAHQSLTGMYDDFGDELEEVGSVIDRVEWMLDQVESAKFRLLQSEAPLRAASAEWVRQGEEDGPNGILYLTDQRVLFEQKEKVTTKKILFVKLKTEMLHEFMFEAPVSSIEEVSVGEQRDGFLGLGKTEILELRFDHTAQYSSALFHLKSAKAEKWEGLIGRARSGDIDKARTGEAVIEAEALDEARSEIPTNCPNCSGPLEATAVRGMTSISCPFCGTVIQL
jgi:hypothetical protein